MTPKEKAKELVEKFLDIKLNDTRPRDLSSSQAKQCALICVDEIIKELDNIEFSESGVINNCVGQDEWQEVKTEIEKL